MKCPHCGENFHPQLVGNSIKKPKVDSCDNEFRVICTVCAACYQTIMTLENFSSFGGGHEIRHWNRILYPKNSLRNIPQDIPESIKQTFTEAVQIQNESPRASAALARSCMEFVLNEQEYKAKNLSEQIKKFQQDAKIPETLHTLVEVVRNYGNFIHSTTTGVITDVEEGEADLCLDIIEELCEFFYTRPKRHKEKLDALNSKLEAIGKKPVKLK